MFSLWIVARNEALNCLSLRILSQIVRAIPILSGVYAGDRCYLGCKTQAAIRPHRLPVGLKSRKSGHAARLSVQSQRVTVVGFICRRWEQLRINENKGWIRLAGDLRAGLSTISPVSMISWTYIFLVLALVAGVFGFSQYGGAVAGVARVLCFQFLGLAVCSALNRQRVNF